MTKTVITIILTVIGVMFTMQNFDHVSVFFFWGKPVQIRMIFVMAISGVVGYLVRHFSGIAREEKLKRQIQNLVLRRNASSAKRKKDLFKDENF